MEKETLKALKKSIAHWKRLATGKGKPEEGPFRNDCALCLRFFESDCINCPVRNETGQSQCGSTPYRYLDIYTLYRVRGIKSDAFRTAAKIELEFLQSLLP